jgi:hypothetical protein
MEHPRLRLKVDPNLSFPRLRGCPNVPQLFVTKQFSENGAAVNRKRSLQWFFVRKDQRRGRIPTAQAPSPRAITLVTRH